MSSSWGLGLRARAVLTLSLPADPTLARGRSVINVIVPEGRAQFFQQLGYVLATLLLFILLLITVVLVTRQRRRGGEAGHLGVAGAGMGTWASGAPDMPSLHRLQLHGPEVCEGHGVSAPPALCPAPAPPGPP